MDQKRVLNGQLPPDNNYYGYNVMNNDTRYPITPKYHFWLSENYDFFSQSMPINLPLSPLPP